MTHYEIEVPATVRGGELRISYRQRFLDTFKTWPDCRVLLSVKKVYRQRSNQENSYFHAVIVPMVKEGMYDAGWENINSNKAAKDYLRNNFFKKEIVNQKTGESEEMVCSTSAFTTVEFEEILERIRRWAAEYLYIYIPLPNEQTELFRDGK